MGRVSMSIKIVCKCSRAYWVPDDKGGKRLACKACGAAITVPAAQPAAQHLVPNAGEARPRPKHQHRADKPTAVPRRLPDEIRNKAIAAGQALASNPCCSKLDFFQYFLCRPLQALMMVNILLFGIGLSIAFHNPLPMLPALAGVVIYAWRKTRLVRRVIFTGNVNPGIIIGKRPWRVAIYTDLSTGFQGPRPAVKIMKAPVLNWMTGGPPEIGKRVCAPSTYMKGPDPCAWTSFFPFVFETLVRDPAEAQAVMDSVDPVDWAPLEAWVRRNPNPQFGLYRLWPGASNALVKDGKKQLILTIAWTFHAAALIWAAVAFDDMRNRTRTDDAPVIFQPIHRQPPPAAPVQPPVAPAANPGQSQSDPQNQLENSRQEMKKAMDDAVEKQRQIFERQKQVPPPSVSGQ